MRHKFFGNIMVGQWEFEGHDLMFPTQLLKMDKEGKVTWSEATKHKPLLWPEIDGKPGVYDEAE